MALRRWASLAAVVVLPEPCRPTIRMTERVSGPLRARSWRVSPRKETSLSWRSLTNIWPGDTERSTFSPLASSMVELTKRRTTRTLTSASRRASLTASTASSIFFSLMAPLPEMKRRASPKARVSFSNMVRPY